MTKDELKNKIKALVKQVYSAGKSTEIDVDSPSVVSLDSERFPVLVKFPTLKDALARIDAEETHAREMLEDRRETKSELGYSRVGLDNV